MRAGRPVLWATRAASKRGVGGLRLLAAETAAHPRADADDHVLAQAETVGHDGLDLARVLGRGVDGHLAPLARDGQGRLRLQVEMLLAAGAKGPLDHVLGPRQGGLERRRAPAAGSGR